MNLPETRYATAGDVDIAYATVGDGPVDLVWAYGLLTHLELKWEEPSLAAMLRRLAEFSRLIMFDRRGCGLSDRGDRYLSPTLEERVEDLVAVLDAVGSRRASLFGVSEGCALAVLFASMHPQRTHSIVLYGGTPRIAKDAEHPWGATEASQLLEDYAPVMAHWGTVEGAAAHVRLIAPSMADDPDYVEWFARQQRHSLSRDSVVTFMTSVVEYDVEDIMPAVRVPALVLHRRDDVLIPGSVSRRTASRIPGARFVELPGTDHLPYVGDSDAVVDAIHEFLSGEVAPAPADHQLVTLLATDAVDAESEALVRRHVHRMGGTEVTGDDGTPLARFGTATRAVRCGLGIVDSSERRGVPLRVCAHTGECEIRTAGVRGPAAHVPRALLAVADPGRVVVTGTVRDVVPGSGIRFTDESLRRLPGLPGEHRVLTVVSPAQVRSESLPGVPAGSARANVFRLDGEYWTLGFENRASTVRDSKGMRDLRALLEAPGRERHVLDLWSEGADPEARSAHARGEGLAPPAAPDPVLDAEARDAYRRRLAVLDELIDGASDHGRADEVSDAREEREMLVDQLTTAYGVGGRVRRIPDEVERARKAVRRRIADALTRIERADPALGRHLRHSVHTGVYCSYAPERDIPWDTGASPVT